MNKLSKDNLLISSISLMIFKTVHNYFLDNNLLFDNEILHEFLIIHCHGTGSIFPDNVCDTSTKTARKLAFVSLIIQLLSLARLVFT